MSFLMPTYDAAPITVVRGDGLWVEDTNGRRFLDFATGVATVPLGHGHPRWVEAVNEQIRNLVHVSNLYGTEPKERLAEKLVEVAGFGQVFLSNSGAEANEAAFKLARRFGAKQRRKFVALNQSFHGRTFLTLALGDDGARIPPYEPRPDNVIHVPANDSAALRSTVDTETAAVVLEPILGAGGVVPLRESYLQAARDLCDQHGALLILDEVQTGMGRTGTWFAYQGAGIQPDIVTVSKGLGNGLPIGATIARPELAFTVGEHGSNFGAGPVQSVAALVVLQVIEEEGLLDNARLRGERLMQGLRGLLTRFPGLGEVRGRGLLVGLSLFGSEAPSPTAVTTELLNRGFLATKAGTNVIRFTPPLTVTDEAVDELVEATGSVLDHLVDSVVPA